MRALLDLRRGVLGICVSGLVVASAGTGTASASSEVVPQAKLQGFFPVEPAARTEQPRIELAFSEPAEGRWARDVVLPYQPLRQAPAFGPNRNMPLPFSLLPLSPLPSLPDDRSETLRRFELPGSVTLRAGPSGDARALGTIAAGTSVEVRRCSDGWCAVAADKRSGYIAERLLTERASPAQTRATPRKALARKAPSASEPAEVIAPAKPPVKIFVPSNR